MPFNDITTGQGVPYTLHIRLETLHIRTTAQDSCMNANSDDRLISCLASFPFRSYASRYAGLYV